MKTLSRRAKKKKVYVTPRKEIRKQKRDAGVCEERCL
jgi:hypothetical protein